MAVCQASARESERFHQTLQRELLDDVDVWPDLETAQAAVDAFRLEYNTNQPHQAHDMAFPAVRFTARPDDERLPLRLPATLTGTSPTPPPTPASPPLVEPSFPAPLVVANGGEPVNLAVEIRRTVPASGNLAVCGQQFWLGPGHAGRTVTLWADATAVHLLLGGARLTTVPSRLTVTHLRQRLADGGRPAGPPPIPTSDAQASTGPTCAHAIEVGTTSISGPVSLTAGRGTICQ